MQTPSHFLVTAVLGRKLPVGYIPVHYQALLIGSILPDLPFFLLTLGGEIYFRWFKVLPVAGSIMEHLHFTLFFTDPLWVISHNFFHSLLIDSMLLALGYYGFRARKGWGAALFWLAVSLQFHTIIDIFTHHIDGPLFLFPLNWSYRFPSPLSYWEVGYYGQSFAWFEWTLDVLIIGYGGIHWLRARRRPRASL